MPDASSCTVSALLEINQHLNIECCLPKCRHKARWSAQEAVARLGPATPIAGLARRLRCARCGAKGRHGHISTHVCTLDWEAWRVREEWARFERGEGGRPKGASLEESLAVYRQLLGNGRDLGGDGPVPPLVLI